MGWNPYRDKEDVSRRLGNEKKARRPCGHRAFQVVHWIRVQAPCPIRHYTPENGCLAVSFLASISLALGSFFIARAIASLVAS